MTCLSENFRNFTELLVVALTSQKMPCNTREKRKALLREPLREPLAVQLACAPDPTQSCCHRDERPGRHSESRGYRSGSPDPIHSRIAISDSAPQINQTFDGESSRLCRNFCVITSESRRTLLHFSRSARLTFFCTAPISNFQQKFIRLF